MSGFGGLRVILVEDEPIVAMMLEDMLADLGCTVVGQATAVRDGLRLVAAGGFELAVLDINLNGERSDPIAAALETAGLPFLFATGYGPAGLEGGTSHPVIQKPYSADQLAAAIAAARD